MKGRIKNKGKLVIVLFILSIVLIIIFLLYSKYSKEITYTDDNILEDTKNTNTNTNTYEDLTDYGNKGESNITDMTENAAQDLNDGSDLNDLTDLTEETTGPPIKSKVYQNKFDYLRAKYNNNEDVIGIVKIPGTTIYYPVMYYDKDNEFYLNRNPYKQPNSAGSIFMDFENNVERSDPNTILYGHQMSANSNTMFHTLSYYTDANFFINHRYIIFSTIYENNVWEVFAYFIADTSFYYIQVFFNSERAFLDLAAEMKAKSIYDTGIDIKEGDRILTLSTCTNMEPDTRYVLAARLIKNKDDVPAEILKEMNAVIDDFK